VGRHLVWSIALHLVVILGGALLAPLGSFGDSSKRPMDIISVGLVASTPRAPGPAVPEPQLQTPEPAMDDAVAIAPQPDLTRESVADPEPEPIPEEPEEQQPEQPEEKPEERPEEKPKEAESKPRSKPADTVTSGQLAQTDGQRGTTGSITDGTGSGGDVWGVETDASVNPYHRRGFISIRNNWRNPATGPRPLKCVVKFRVLRSGTIEDVVLEQRSGSELFNRQALRAVQLTGSWDPFPRFWEENEQIIHLEFEYRP
jgi:TonB family protein